MRNRPTPKRVISTIAITSETEASSALAWLLYLIEDTHIQELKHVSCWVVQSFTRLPEIPWLFKRTHTQILNLNILKIMFWEMAMILFEKFLIRKMFSPSCWNLLLLGLQVKIFYSLISKEGVKRAICARGLCTIPWLRGPKHSFAFQGHRACH